MPNQDKLDSDHSIYETMRQWAELCKKPNVDRSEFPAFPANVMANMRCTVGVPSISMTFSIPYDWGLKTNYVRKKKIENIFNI